MLKTRMEVEKFRDRLLKINMILVISKKWMQVNMGKKVSKEGQNQFRWGDTVFKDTGKERGWCRRMLKDGSEKLSWISATVERKTKCCC